MGYSLHSRAYRLSDPWSDNIIDDADAHFDERPDRFDPALVPNLDLADDCLFPEFTLG